jgi:hypothetical protein
MSTKPKLAPVLEAQTRFEISLVPYGVFTSILSGLSKHLEIAARWSAGRSSADDIVRMIMVGQYNLWVVIDTDNKALVGFFATELKQYPQRRMLCVQHCVVDPGHLKELEPRIEELGIRFAQDNGCTGIEFVGRPGWRKYARVNGYASHSVVYQKFFEPKKH